MAFCSNCGVRLEEGVKFCSSCGTPLVSAGIEIKQEKAENFIQAQPSALPVSSVVQNQNTPIMAQTITADERYCFSCGAVIKKAAEICPKCGVNQSMRISTTAIDVYCTSCGKTIKKEASICPFCGVVQEAGSFKNRTTALLLCIFTGVGHRFYVGQIGSAIIMGLCYILGIILCGLTVENEVFAIPGLILILVWIIQWIVDLVSICTSKFLDKQGKVLKKN